MPLAISASFLICMVVGIAQGTLARQPDEGAAAHLFQLLMPVQALVIVWFAAAWLRKRPRAAVPVLLLQGVGFLAVLSVVYLRHL